MTMAPTSRTPQIRIFEQQNVRPTTTKLESVWRTVNTRCLNIVSFLLSHPSMPVSIVKLVILDSERLQTNLRCYNKSELSFWSDFLVAVVIAHAL